MQQQILPLKLSNEFGVACGDCSCAKKKECCKKYKTKGVRCKKCPKR